MFVGNEHRCNALSVLRVARNADDLDWSSTSLRDSALAAGYLAFALVTAQKGDR